MKRLYITTIALGLSTASFAQDTYMNERLVNNASEINGTARYVGMGGSMGALGADMSCMDFNPAGIGLYRRNDFALTAGAQWNIVKADNLKNSRGTFDQIGCVITSLTDNEKHPFVMFGINYQKKINFAGSYIADGIKLNGLSQMDQLVEIVNEGYGTLNNVAGAAGDYGFLTPVLGDDGNQVVTNRIPQYYNKYNGDFANYTHVQWGGLSTYNLNVAGNWNDRIYWGATVGIESLKYHAETDYYEASGITEDGTYKRGDYSLYNNTFIDGWGFNFKLGVIGRPFEESPLRIGIAMETPTWYKFNASNLYQLYDEIDQVGYSSHSNRLDESFLEFAVRSPIKGRFSIGSSVKNFFLWNVDYEIANYGTMRMGYTKSYNNPGADFQFNNEKDCAMKEVTRGTLKHQHTIRAGLEAKPSDNISFRLGYSYTTSPYKDNVSFDQWSISGYSLEQNRTTDFAMDYCTRTSFWKVSDTHTITLGLGYKWKKIYIDAAYKIRGQKADLYVFDDSFNNVENPIITNEDGTPAKIESSRVNLGRQNFTCTFGFKF